MEDVREATTASWHVLVSLQRISILRNPKAETLVTAWFIAGRGQHENEIEQVARIDDYDLIPNAFRVALFNIASDFMHGYRAPAAPVIIWYRPFNLSLSLHTGLRWKQ